MLSSASCRRHFGKGLQHNGSKSFADASGWKPDAARWKRALPFLFALFALAMTSFAKAPDDFGAANQFYDQGKFSEAKQRYESLVQANHFSSNLFYNLGNTEWKLGNLGAAALDYERALVLEPNHPEARSNLQFVRNQTGAKIETPHWWQRLFPNISASHYAILAAVAGWAALFCLAAILFRARSDTGAPRFAAVACLLICAYGLSAIWLAEKNSALAIITAKRAAAHVAPADTASLADTLAPGSRVRVLHHRGAWTYCELPNHARAWIATNAMERVKPPRS